MSLCRRNLAWVRNANHLMMIRSMQFRWMHFCQSRNSCHLPSLQYQMRWEYRWGACLLLHLPLYLHWRLIDHQRLRPRVLLSDLLSPLGHRWRWQWMSLCRRNVGWDGKTNHHCTDRCLPRHCWSDRHFQWRSIRHQSIHLDHLQSVSLWGWYLPLQWCLSLR